MRTLGTLLFVACLIADMATPFWPGAFRFDAAESIDAVGSRAPAAPATHADAARLPERDVPGATWSCPRPRVDADIVARAPIRTLLPRAALLSILSDPSPRSAEDA